VFAVVVAADFVLVSIDGEYQGPQFAKAPAKALRHLDVEIVKRSDRVSGFAVLPKRWIVERSIAWRNRC
jgi:transposase